MLRLTRLVLALALLVALWPSWSSAQTRAGVVTNLEGSATAARAALPQPVSLKFKDDVFQNDRIVTGDRSIVRMLLGGKAVVTVRERSSLTITETPGKSTIDLDNGKIAVAVARERMRPGEQIEVKTPNAVAAVRGTVFIIEVIRATAQGPGGGPVGGVTTHAWWFSGTGTINFGGGLVNMAPGLFASGLGNQPPNFHPMTTQDRQQGQNGLHLGGQNFAGGGNGAKDNANGQFVLLSQAFLQVDGGGGNGGLGNQNGNQGGNNQPPILPGGSQNLGGGNDNANSGNSGGVFKPSGTPSGILVFGDYSSSTAQLGTDLQSLGHSVLMNVATLPADLSAFGTIWHASAFVPLTAAEQTRLAAFLALGRGLHLTGERPCCDPMNDSLTTLVRSVVVGGSGITVGNQGDIDGPYNFNSTARGNITNSPNLLVSWNPSASGGMAGVTGNNVLVTGAGGVPVGAVWDHGDLVGNAGRLTLLMDVNWFSNEGRLAVIENIEQFIDAPPAILNLAGPLFRSVSERLDAATTFLGIRGYTVVGSGSDPLVALSGTTVTTAGDFVRLIDSSVSAAGSFTRLDNGAGIVQTGTAEPLVSMSGGTLTAGTGGAGHLFDLVGRPGNTQVDGDTGLTLGTDRPLQPGSESAVFEATNGAAVSVAGSAYRLDTALLEATAPLINLAGGASLTTGAHTIDLVNQAKISIPNDAVALINLNGSSLSVTNGSLVNVAGGSSLSLAGSLLSLSGGSTVNILNGLLLNVGGGSNVGIGGSLVSFSGVGNLLSVNNSFAPTAIIGGVPVYGPAGSVQIGPNALAGLGTAGTIRINGVALTPTTPLASLTGSLVAVQGSGRVRVGN